MSLFKIRSSSLTDFQDCNRRGFYRIFRSLIESLPSISGHKIWSSIGIATHQSVAYTLRKKLKEEQPRLNDAVEVAIVNINEAYREDMEFDDDTRNINEAHKQLKSIVGTYYKDLLPTVNHPAMVESELTGKIGNIVLVGHPDLVDRSDIADNAGLTVKDLKVGKGGYHYHSQLGAYAILVEAAGKQVNGIEIQHIIRPSKTHIYPGERIGYDLEGAKVLAWNLIELLQGYYNKFDKSGGDNRFIPVNPSSRLCSKKYCPVWGTEWCKLFK